MSDVPAQRILVVDDDEFECGNMVRKMLQKMGHPREVAEDALEAPERHADEQFGLVISDVAMPGKDGLDLAKEARAKYPDVDFIIMPGHGTALPFISITNVRAFDLIVKSFSGEELAAKIDLIVRKKRVIQHPKEANEEPRLAYDEINNIMEQTIQALASALDMRDPYTAGHQNRVSALACAIAGEMCNG